MLCARLAHPLDFTRDFLFFTSPRAIEQVAYMRNWSLALTLMAVLLLALVLLAVVRPPVYAVQKNKDGTKEVSNKFFGVSTCRSSSILIEQFRIRLAFISHSCDVIHFQVFCICSWTCRPKWCDHSKRVARAASLD